jgi:Uma2 family endonuclease
MSAVLQRPRMTRAEFLAWDEVQERRIEYDGVGPVAMVGGMTDHSLIKVNLYRELSTRRRGTPCRAFDSDMRIDAGGSIRYPKACSNRTGSPRPSSRERMPNGSAG